MSDRESDGAEHTAHTSQDDYDDVEGVGECQHPGCENTAKIVGMLTVGDKPLGPLYVCPEHDEVLS